jgi:hypothetical protein
MSRKEKIPSALRHGVYSTLTLLPGESAAAFNKLCKDVKAELNPTGPLEEDVVAQVARLLWRKQNLAIFSVADRARDRYSIIRGDKTEGGRRIIRVRCTIFGDDNGAEHVDRDDPEKSAAEREAVRALETRARSELGNDEYELVKSGKVSIEQLLSDLTVEERLDAMIDRCYKCFLYLKGLKSMVNVPSSAPPRLIPGLSQVA